jgi:cellulose synthase/poly-beta-1,6-N-acetylglucosamine synthase-like glycosyltransferase
MIYVKYIAFSIIGIYALLILYFFYGWCKLRLFADSRLKDSMPLSVIVACRNEEHNIAELLRCLIAQNYPTQKTEIILINDHSIDNTKRVALECIRDYGHIKLYDLPNGLRGKKDAISFGVEKSGCDLIVTTDADCTMNQNWLRELILYYKEKKPKLISGPVCLKYEETIFQKFQALEFLSLIGSGAGAMGVHKAIMCNAANMLFEKSLYKQCCIKNDLASGDDMFLMLCAKAQNKKNIQFIKSREAIVSTEAAKGIKSFYHQRVRWTSKSKAYKDPDIIFTAILVALTNIILGVSMIYSITNLTFSDFTLLFLLKSVSDFILLFSVTRFFKSKKLMLYFIPLQIIYPFYIITTVLFGLIGNFKWKDRTF